MEPRSDKKQVVFNFRDEDSDHNEASRKETSNLENSSNNNSKNNTENILNMSSKSVDDRIKEEENNDRRSEGDKDHLKSHIISIDGYDRLNIKRQSIKRKTRKNKTEFIPKNNLKIERFNNDIIKITEDLINLKLSENNTKKSDDIRSDSDFNSKNEKVNSSKNVLESNNLDNLEEDKDRRSSIKKKTIRFANKRVTFQYPKEIEVMKFSGNNDNMSNSTNDNEIDLEKLEKLEKEGEDKKENNSESDSNYNNNVNSSEKETSQFGFNEEEN